MIKLNLRRSDWMGDWFVLEREVHDDGDYEMVAPDDISKDGRIMAASHMPSSRVGDADVEGTAEEWAGMLAALRGGGSYSAKRCAVRPVERRGAAVWSPRNSRELSVLDKETVDYLVPKIEATLAAWEASPKEEP